jgi:hypothetical protein
MDELYKQITTKQRQVGEFTSHNILFEQEYSFNTTTIDDDDDDDNVLDFCDCNSL